MKELSSISADNSCDAKELLSGKRKPVLGSNQGGEQCKRRRNDVEQNKTNCPRHGYRHQITCTTCRGFYDRKKPSVREKKNASNERYRNKLLIEKLRKQVVYYKDLAKTRTDEVMETLPKAQQLFHKMAVRFSNVAIQVILTRFNAYLYHKNVKVSLARRDSEHSYKSRKYAAFLAVSSVLRSDK